jgi:hypothetical protein
MLRNLRIWFAIACGLICLLLVVLWVRSFVRHGDLAGFGGTNVKSNDGRVVFFTLPNGGGPWRSSDFPPSAAEENTWIGSPLAYGTTPGGPYVTTPYWFLVLVSGVPAFLLGFRRPYRFSLRTLLVAMTALAIVLALAVASQELSR